MLDISPNTAVTTEEQSADARRARSLYAPMIVLLPMAWWVVIAAHGGVDTPVDEQPGTRAERVLATLDPNTAAWWELTALPRIGAVTARRIIAYRDERAPTSPDAPAFSAPHDLERVPGIGPKTAGGVAVYLRFEPSPADQPADSDAH